jgi:hypothetical protein
MQLRDTQETGYKLGLVVSLPKQHHDFLHTSFDSPSYSVVLKPSSCATASRETTMSAITKISLLALIFVGGATLHGLSVSTGYYDLVNAHKVKGVLSDGALYDPIITGFGGLDDLLGTLVQFFYPCTDGTAPGLSLQSLLFSGQGFAFFIIWLLEGHRAGNKGRLIS